jgi:hypothetical protein
VTREAILTGDAAVTDYFVRHYTLVIDNNETAYEAVTAAATEVVLDSGISRSAWLGLAPTQRLNRYALKIGRGVLDRVTDWCREVAPPDTGHPGSQLIYETLAFRDPDVAIALGEHYMPTDDDIPE